MNTLGERIKDLRGERNTSQEALSKEAGISRSNISKIESNSIKPTSSTIVAIARFFDVTTDWLLTGEATIISNTADQVTTECVVHERSHYYSAADKKKAYCCELLGRLDENGLKRAIEFLEFELYRSGNKKRNRNKNKNKK